MSCFDPSSFSPCFPGGARFAGRAQGQVMYQYRGHAPRLILGAQRDLLLVCDQDRAAADDLQTAESVLALN